MDKGINAQMSENGREGGKEEGRQKGSSLTKTSF
jgi:hypothetical protein